MRTITNYKIQVLTNSPCVTAMGPISEEFMDDHSDIEDVGDEEGTFYFETKERVNKEIERLKDIQPRRSPAIRFRVVETIINIENWI